MILSTHSHCLSSGRSLTKKFSYSCLLKAEMEFKINLTLTELKGIDHVIRFEIKMNKILEALMIVLLYFLINIS